MKENDYSEITQRLLGRKMRLVLNLFITLLSYAFMMCFICLVYELLGRFYHSAFKKDEYAEFKDFKKAKWGKVYIKYPVYIVATAILFFICLIRDINKLNFTSYIGVCAVIYTLGVVAIQCHSYYKYYKETKYVEDDKSTHPNYWDITDAFTSELDFFKGLSNLFAAYCCHCTVFPIFAGFKIPYEGSNVDTSKEGVNIRDKLDYVKEVKANQDKASNATSNNASNKSEIPYNQGPLPNYINDGITKMRYGTIIGMTITTILHVISIVCGFLTDPYQPEDLIIYRKNKGTGRDIAMVLARLLISISLLASYPAYYFPLRLCIANAFTGGKISNCFNFVFTLCSCIGCTLVAAIYDKILNYLNYIGGFLSVYISYMNPVLIYIYSSGKPITYWKNLLQLFLSILLCIIGVIGGIVTIIDDVKN